MEFMESLRTLLTDICKFLDTEILMTNQSTEVKSMAMRLMTRVVKMKEKSLMEFPDPNSYTDMSKQPELIAEYIGPDCKPEDVYDSAPDIHNANDSKPEVDCPYKKTVINQLHPIIAGTLKREARWNLIKIFKGNPMYHAVLLDEWFLLYPNNPNPKKTHPLEYYLLKNCKAMSIEHEEDAFSFNADDKAFTMIALSRKEMCQWISAINDITNFKSALEDPPESFKSKYASMESNYYADIEIPPNQVTVRSTNTNRVLPEIPPQQNLPEYMNSNTNNNQTSSSRVTSLGSLPVVQTPQTPVRPLRILTPNAPSARTSQIPTPPVAEEEIYQLAEAPPENSNDIANNNNNNNNRNINRNNSAGSSGTTGYPACLMPPQLPPHSNPQQIDVIEDEIYQESVISNDYHHPPAINIGGPPEDIYNYAQNPDDDVIYASIDESEQYDSRRYAAQQQQVIMNPIQQVPPPPRERNMINELKLKHKLKHNLPNNCKGRKAEK